MTKLSNTISKLEQGYFILLENKCKVYLCKTIKNFDIKKQRIKNEILAELFILRKIQKIEILSTDDTEFFMLRTEKKAKTTYLDNIEI